MSKNSEKNKNLPKNNNEWAPKSNKKKSDSFRWWGYWTIVVLVIAFWLNAAQNSKLAPIFWAWSWAIEVVSENESLTLNQWLDHYQSWDFRKVNVINDRDLEWYSFIKTWEKSILWFSAPTEEFKLYKSEKAESVSVVDMWLQLTWDIEISFVLLKLLPILFSCEFMPFIPVFSSTGISGRRDINTYTVCPV